MTLTFGSLFSGIGGFDLGLERAGMQCRWQVEIDPFCQRVLEKHWPDVPRYGDITQLDFTEVEPVDLICGGFPCQDISVAGKRVGITGARSGLWSEYLRSISTLRPRFVAVENVPALTVRGLGTVLGDLAACGYDAEWDCLPAAAFGAPHFRDRIWIIAYPGEVRRDPRGTEQSLQRFGAHSPVSMVSQRREEQFCPESDESQFASTECSGWWGIEPTVGRVAYGVPGRVDRIAALGNAIVPQVAEWIGRRIVETAS